MAGIYSDCSTREIKLTKQTPLLTVLEQKCQQYRMTVIGYKLLPISLVLLFRISISDTDRYATKVSPIQCHFHQQYRY